MRGVAVSIIKGNWQVPLFFRCVLCAGTYVTPVRSGRFSVGDISYECVVEFCYLGDVISVGDGVETSSLANRSGYKLRELFSLLNMKEFPLHAKGKLYTACGRTTV